MKKRFLILALSLFCLLCLAACDNGGSEAPTPPAADDGLYRVLVALDEGARVVGDNPVALEYGQTAVFEIALDKGYVFDEVSFGTYDGTTGLLTVENITNDMTVDFYTTAVDYDTEQEVRFILHGNAEDRASVSRPLFRNKTALTVPRMQDVDGASAII